MILHNNISILPYNTFNIDVEAAVLAECPSEACVVEALKLARERNLPFLCIGGGSNMLFTSNFNGVLIHPTIEGIEKTEETSEYVMIKVGAGVVWDNFVEYCVANNLGGLENLSAIPGSVGASPVQNIGAYGAEAGQCIECVEGVMATDFSHFKIEGNKCQFAYRNSIFKQELRNKCVITFVTFKLQKNHKINTSYGSIASTIEKYGEPTLLNIRKAIIEVRNQKLPDPKIEGNAGSFFKNPEVSSTVFNSLIAQYPNMPHYVLDNNMYKIPAAWFIDQCGLKGKTLGKTGVHTNQPLVLVNKGGATGNEIIELCNFVIEQVQQKFNVTIQPEVNII